MMTGLLVYWVAVAIFTAVALHFGKPIVVTDPQAADLRQSEQASVRSIAIRLFVGLPFYSTAPASLSMRVMSSLPVLMAMNRALRPK